MSGKTKRYIERRFEEEGLDTSEFLGEGKAFREGKERLNLDYQSPNGWNFRATEGGGQAKFKILEHGKEVFDLGDLAPNGVKFFTPTHWLSSGRFTEMTANGVREIPEDRRRSLQGAWQRGEDFVSVGSMTSIRDVLPLLHELGHSGGSEDEIRNAKARGDWKKAAELVSKSERDAWANALKMAKKVKKDTGVDLLEGFSGDDDLKTYIHTALSGHRFLSEFELSGIPTDFLKDLILGKYKMDPASKGYEWLDKLFDKRELVKGKTTETTVSSTGPVKLGELDRASRDRDAKELEKTRGDLKKLMEPDVGKK